MEKQCPYCSFPAKNLMTAGEDEDTVVLEVTGNFLRMFDCKMPGFTELRKINYCPMCGRKLEEMRTPQTVILGKSPRGERPYEDLAKSMSDAAGWSAEDYAKNARYVSTLLWLGGDYICELLHKAHAAAERLCDACGVCSHGKRDPFDCEIADLDHREDVPIEYFEAGGK